MTRPARANRRTGIASRVKRLAEGVASLLTVGVTLRYRLAHRLLGEARAIQGLSERVAQWPGTGGLLMRAAVYRRVLRRVGRDVHVGYGSLFSKAEARLGDGAYIGRYCTIGWVDIGEAVRVADGVQLLSGRHHHAADEGTVQLAPIAVGRGAWIGANAVVMADVGEGATIGAGAVVTRPVDPGDTVGGVPARPLPRPGLAAA